MERLSEPSNQVEPTADGARPLLVVTMGLPATGKTSLARELARRLGLVHLSSDVVRKELAGLAPNARRRDDFGTGLYDPSMTRRTYEALRRRAATHLRRGRSVVLDATFGRVEERAAIRRLAARAGARVVFLVCQADEATIGARLAARVRDPDTASDARPELWEALRSAFTDPMEVPGAISVDMTEPLARVTDRVVAILCERHAPSASPSGS
jgi:predicted kinase